VSSFRGLMTMRATVQRNNASTSRWGQPGAPGWSDVADVACYAVINSGTSSGREILGGSGDQEVVVLSTLHVYMPEGTDVTEKDRLLAITDRQGAELFPGPMDIKSVDRRPGRMLDVTVRSYT
jgi:hypothetical protein